ncbi:MAG: DUF5716 family protein [Bacillota bacterium]|nr:DUF5716 family protein [Bacillota bacterium]
MSTKNLEVTPINLFSIIPANFFTPLTSKHKQTYMDCLALIYDSYKSELSFGVDKEVIVSKLEDYFDQVSGEEMVFEDEDNEVAVDSRAKANAILRRLKDSGWIEFEMAADYRVKVNMLDYAATTMESFTKIMKRDEMEYQSLVSQIHATLLNQEAYAKPYEFIIKRIAENTEELMNGLKKLNTNIRKYIDAITNEKDAGEIVRDFFVYHQEIGSKAYHRIKTSDNISHFRTSIIENLHSILSDPQIFDRAVKGYMDVEEVSDRYVAEEALRHQIRTMMSAFRNYDDIISEIDHKNTRYISSAVARARFLLTNSNNAEGKIAQILKYLADEFNKDETLNLYDEMEDPFLALFQLFPQHFLDQDSLHVQPITKKVSIPQALMMPLGISAEERALRKLAEQEKLARRFSRKNINAFVLERLEGKQTVLASTLPLESKRELIRIIFISLHGRDPKSHYRAIPTKNVIAVNQYRFCDFLIERSDG